VLEPQLESGSGPDAQMDACLLVTRDTDGDGYANACDPDLNNDGIVNFVDLATLQTRFLTDDADADFNGDGIVNFVDLGVLSSMFFGAPGPQAIGPGGAGRGIAVPAPATLILLAAGAIAWRISRRSRA
jgi:hypothetical protein